jgi:hypothetical protein
MSDAGRSSVPADAWCHGGVHVGAMDGCDAAFKAPLPARKTCFHRTCKGGGGIGHARFTTVPEAELVAAMTTDFARASFVILRLNRPHAFVWTTLNVDRLCDLAGGTDVIERRFVDTERSGCSQRVASGCPLCSL